MRFSAVIGSALTAGLVLSAPLEKRVYTTDWVVEVVTSTTTVYPDTAAVKPTPAPAGFLQGAPFHATSVPAQPAYTSAPVSSEAPPQQLPSLPPPPPPPAASSVYSNPTTAPSNGLWQPVDVSKCATSISEGSIDLSSPPSQCGRSWLDDINMWRKAYDKSELSWSGTLAQSAYNAAKRNPFAHNDLGEINAFGETETAGNVTPYGGDMKGASPFGLALAVGWLCESPGDPQLQADGFTGFNVCGDFNKVMSMRYTSGTAHHDIFLADHSEIGCAWSSAAGGQIVCDYR